MNSEDNVGREEDWISRGQDFEEEKNHGRISCPYEMKLALYKRDLEAVGSNIQPKACSILSVSTLQELRFTPLSLQLIHYLWSCYLNKRNRRSSRISLHSTIYWLVKGFPEVIL